MKLQYNLHKEIQLHFRIGPWHSSLSLSYDLMSFAIMQNLVIALQFCFFSAFVLLTSVTVSHGTGGHCYGYFTPVKSVVFFGSKSIMVTITAI